MIFRILAKNAIFYILDNLKAIMVLIISIDKFYGTDFSATEIITQILHLELKLLEKISKIIILEKTATINDKFNFEPYIPYGQNVAKYDIGSDKTLNDIEAESKCKRLSTLLKNFTSSNIQFVSVKKNIKQLMSEEVVFYYPLYSPDFSNLIQILPKVELYIDLFYSCSKLHKGVIRVEYLQDFFDIIKILTRNMRSKYVNNDKITHYTSRPSDKSSKIPDDMTLEDINDEYDTLTYYQGEIRQNDSVGYYFTKTFLGKHISPKLSFLKYYFIGSYDHYFKYIFEYLNWGEGPYSFFYDLKNGLPLSLEPNYSFLIFINIDYLSFQEQLQLWKLIEDYNYSERGIFLHANTDNLCPPIKSQFHSVTMFATNHYANDLVEILIAFLTEKQKFTLTQWMRQDLILNGFHILLVKMKEITYLSKFMETIEIDGKNFFTVEFWYNFILEIKEMEKRSESYVERRINKKKEYYMYFRGDYWMISFGYHTPMIVLNTIGLKYIAGLMKNPEMIFEAKKLLDVVNPKNKSKKNHVNVIRTAVKKTITRIEAIEVDLFPKDKLSPEGELIPNHDFSEYLKKIFLPTTLSNEIGVPHSDTCFRDNNKTCKCILPNQPAIKWKISTPIDFSSLSVKE
jgi:hypothetical protein